MYPAWYCTLDDARLAIKANTFTDDDVIARFIPQVSERIRLFTGLDFEPSIDTLDVRVTPDRVSSTAGTLLLLRPILELAGVVANGTALTVGTQVRLSVPATRFGAVRSIELVYPWTCNGWYACCSHDSTAQVSGVFGFHRDYARDGWQPSGDAVANLLGIDASATSITVTDADGFDAFGFTPRFSRGNLIRIDDEFMRIVAVNATTNTLTILRGQRGSTAVSHLLDAPISVWNIEPDIRRAAYQWVALLYARRGSFEQRVIDGVGITTYPADAPTEVIRLLQPYQNV
jgi:hypothetical protein